jgi:Type II secretion system (T2SS), protein G
VRHTPHYRNERHRPVAFAFHGEESKPLFPSPVRTDSMIALLLGVCILASVACTPRHSGDKTAKVEFDLSRLFHAAEAFRKDFGRYPVSQDELVDPPGEQSCYIEDPLVDPWTGEPYWVRVIEGQPPIFQSYGSDQKPGGTAHARDLSTEELDVR